MSISKFNRRSRWTILENISSNSLPFDEAAHTSAGTDKQANSGQRHGGRLSGSWNDDLRKENPQRQKEYEEGYDRWA
jgi:hypothetical protein